MGSGAEYSPISSPASSRPEAVLALPRQADRLPPRLGHGRRARAELRSAKKAGPHRRSPCLPLFTSRAARGTGGPRRLGPVPGVGRAAAPGLCVQGWDGGRHPTRVRDGCSPGLGPPSGALRGPCAGEAVHAPGATSARGTQPLKLQVQVPTHRARAGGTAHPADTHAMRQVKA